MYCFACMALLVTRTWTSFYRITLACLFHPFSRLTSPISGIKSTRSRLRETSTSGMAWVPFSFLRWVWWVWNASSLDRRQIVRSKYKTSGVRSSQGPKSSQSCSVCEVMTGCAHTLWMLLQSWRLRDCHSPQGDRVCTCKALELALPVGEEAAGCWKWRLCTQRRACIWEGDYWMCTLLFAKNLPSARLYFLLFLAFSGFLPGTCAEMGGRILWSSLIHWATGVLRTRRFSVVQVISIDFSSEVTESWVKLAAVHRAKGAKGQLPTSISLTLHYINYI